MFSWIPYLHHLRHIISQFDQKLIVLFVSVLNFKPVNGFFRVYV